MYLIINRPSNFNTNIPTKFLVHGFTDSGSSSWILAMKDTYLQNVNNKYLFLELKSTSFSSTITMLSLLIGLLMQHPLHQLMMGHLVYHTNVQHIIQLWLVNQLH